MASARWTDLLWNGAEGRVRALWRVLIIFVAVVAAHLAAGAALVDLGFWGQRLGTALGVQLVVPVIVVAAGARWLDRRPVAGYGLGLGRRWWREFALGALLGLVMYAMAFVVIIAAGWGRVTEVWSAGPEGLWLLFAFAVLLWLTNGFWEELLMRGVVIKNTAEGLGGRTSRVSAVITAVVISSVLFAVVHVPTYLDTPYPLGGLAVMWLLLGGLLGLAYALTGRLGMAMGLHFTVNLAVNNVFGFVGEAGERATVLHTEIIGPDALAAPGGVVHLAVIALAYAALLVWAARRPQGVSFAEELTRPPHAVRAEPPPERTLKTADRQPEKAHR